MGEGLLGREREPLCPRKCNQLKKRDTSGIKVNKQLQATSAGAVGFMAALDFRFQIFQAMNERGRMLTHICVNTVFTYVLFPKVKM